MHLLVSLDVRASAEKYRSRVVVCRGEGKHQGTSARGVHADSIGDVIQGSFRVGRQIKDDSGPVGLNQEAPRGKQPGQGVQIGRQGALQDGRRDGLAVPSWREELVRWVILESIVDISTVPATAKLPIKP